MSMQLKQETYIAIQRLACNTVNCCAIHMLINFMWDVAIYLIGRGVVCAKVTSSLENCRLCFTQQNS